MFTLWLILAFNANSFKVLSYPISDVKSATGTVRWVPEPPTRGTFRLLVSCILTLILCVWTSLHLNIPIHNETGKARLWRKLRWTILALFSPEFVVYSAWMQWVSAKALVQEVNDILDEQSGHNGERQGERWTLAHAFYAGMGGFAFDVSHENEPFLRDGTASSIVVLTARGVRLLAKCGLLPPITKEFIADKSKADSLAKVLVCGQATWCLVQFIGRKASDLPVTLLEVNTLGHALCALAIYLSWWHKPLDIREPYLLSGESVAPLCAYMWMCSHISNSALLDTNLTYGPEFKNLQYFPPKDDRATSPLDPTDKTMIVQVNEHRNLPGTCFRVNPHSRLFTRPTTNKTRFLSKFFFNGPSTSQWHRRKVLILRPEDVKRWKLATMALTQSSYGSVLRLSLRGHTLPTEELVMKATPNWPGNDLMKGAITKQWLFFALAVVSVVYGGLHATGWDTFFPTWQERMLWRVSTVVVATSGVALWTISWLVILIPDLLSRCIGFRFVDSVLTAAVAAVSCLVALVYVCCRGFLVIEAFISVRELPVGAYMTPNWSQLIPHL